MILRYTTLCFVLFCPTFALAAAPPATSVDIFPPKNVQAQGGFLFFPAGGTSSLYAAPVLSDPALLSALGDQTAALKELTSAVQGIKGELSSINSKIGALALTATGAGAGALVPYPSTITCTWPETLGPTKTTSNEIGNISYNIKYLAGSVTVPFQSLSSNVYLYSTTQQVSKAVYSPVYTSGPYAGQPASLFVGFKNVGVYGALRYAATSGQLINSTMVSNTDDGNIVPITCPTKL